MSWLTPAAKVHAALAAAQIAVVTYVCHVADIWRSPQTAEQFPGHLGPSIFIAAIGVTALCHDWPWRKRCAIEGRLSVFVAFAYVAGEALSRALVKGLGGFGMHYMRHGLHAWMCVVIGLCGAGFLLAPRLDPASGEKLRRAPHVWRPPQESAFFFRASRGSAEERNRQPVPRAVAREGTIFVKSRSAVLEISIIFVRLIYRTHFPKTFREDAQPISIRVSDDQIRDLHVRDRSEAASARLRVSTHART